MPSTVAQHIVAFFDVYFFHSPVGFSIREDSCTVWVGAILFINVVD